jgi:hypothetical protein
MVGKKLPEVAWADCSGELQIVSLRCQNETALQIFD